MKSMNYINKIQPQLESAFKSQNPEFFDIVFEIEGKKLYADKLILSINSSTFKSMLSDRWISKNDVVKIETYKFDDFKELLTFIYSGECNLTDENIFTILDMSEFYQIEDLKELCAKYLSKMELTRELLYERVCGEVDSAPGFEPERSANIFQLIEISNKYSMIKTKRPIQRYIFQNFKIIFKSDKFLNTEKFVVTEIIALGQTFAIKYEEMFQAAFEWSENQAIKKQDGLSDETFHMNDAIKVEMQYFLPYIRFNQMEISFFTEYVVKRGFIFNSDEMNDISESVQSNVKVKITNKNGQSIYGLLPKENNAVSVIKSLQDQGFISFYCVYWKTNCEKPSTPSPLKKRIGAKCYLIYFLNGNICVKDAVYITNDHYLLAEMNSETDFCITDNCKIEIV
uniref:BTB domain-containing protein n=1 Tax=Panagrolaimus davidi TaxID=227884 RepID=A0A914P1T0_9BILA